MNKKIFLIFGLLCPFSLFSISFYDEIILFSGMLYNANLSLEFDFKKIWTIDQDYAAAQNEPNLAIANLHKAKAQYKKIMDTDCKGKNILN